MSILGVAHGSDARGPRGCLNYHTGCAPPEAPRVSRDMEVMRCVQAVIGNEVQSTGHRIERQALGWVVAPGGT